VTVVNVFVVQSLLRLTVDLCFGSLLDPDMRPLWTGNYGNIHVGVFYFLPR
jgi:hypothetical protein